MTLSDGLTKSSSLRDPEATALFYVLARLVSTLEFSQNLKPHTSSYSLSRDLAIFIVEASDLIKIPN